jgi:hypothetical protein
MANLRGVRGFLSSLLRSIAEVFSNHSLHNSYKLDKTEG